MIRLLPATGYADLFARLGRLDDNALYPKLMRGIGLLRVVLFAYR